MLVLSRQCNQSVMVGDDVEVRVIDVRGEKVRLGFDAPNHVKIFRKEVYEARKTLRPTEPTPPAPKENATMDPFLRAAIDEARKGLSEGGLPIGSVLVRNNQIIGRGHNRRVQKGDPMAHAEIDCLTNAGRQKTYKDTVLYSTLMPCYLCSGAAVQFGVPKVIVGESVTFHGGESTLPNHTCGLSPQFMKSAGIEVIDLHDAECIQMMTDFIKNNPTLWNEDIGVD